MTPFQDSRDDSYNPNVDFSKIKVGIKSLEDAIYKLGDLKQANPRLTDKDFVLKAINSNDVLAMREISNFFFKTSGIYYRLCKYMAYLYRYDWMVTPYINQNQNNLDNKKITENFNKVLKFLDEFGIKKLFGEIALKVLRYGCYK